MKYKQTVVVMFNPLLGNKMLHIFPSSISKKVNAIVRPEIEPMYCDITVL